MMDITCPVDSYASYDVFPTSFIRYWFIVGLHGVDLLCCSKILDGLKTLWFSAIAGLFVFLWPLRSVLVGVILQYFTLL